MQAEAREALAQAKEMAKMQMELERQKKKKSPIADIVSVLIKYIDSRISLYIILSVWLSQNKSIGIFIHFCFVYKNCTL